MRDARIRTMIHHLRYVPTCRRTTARSSCAMPGASGHTLLELLIAVALTLVTTAGIMALYHTQRAAVRRAHDLAQIREAGSAALTLIGQQVQMGGFRPLDSPVTLVAPAVFGCLAGRVVGTDGTMSCETLSGKSDGIAASYVGDVVSTWASTTGLPTDCLGQGVSNGSGDEAVAGAIITSRFFARTSGSTGEPELYCEGSGRTGSAQPVVEGVEKLRVRYWLAGAADAVDAAAIGGGRWNRVVALDVCVMVRGAPVWSRMRYTDCDGVASIATDGRARRTFRRRIAIRNGEEVTS